jgi:hypothetical protein
VRITIVPVWDAALDLRKALPFDLGHGFGVKDMSELLGSIDLTLWSHYVAPEQQKKITEAGICFTHEYVEAADDDPESVHSLRLLTFVLGHLRFLVPNRTATSLMAQGVLDAGRLDVFRFSHGPRPLILEDAESCSEICESHLGMLKRWMPWIIRLERNWKDLFPLFISLHFSEKAYAEEDPRIRNLLRVMALEALFASGSAFGKKALLPRLPKFLGSGMDLYAQYQSNWQGNLRPLVLAKVIGDVCDLRNKIAHGDTIPTKWLETDYRDGLNYKLCYADTLREAATSMLSLAWKKIVSEGLQDTFAEKAKMEAYFQARA